MTSIIIYKDIYVVFVDRGQERVRNSVLAKCNVWNRLNWIFFFTTRTSVSMDIEQQTKRMMSRHGEKWPCSLLLQENGCSGGKNFLKSTESVHCTFSMHFFEVCPGPDLHKWQEWLYRKEYLFFVDRGQERVRKSVLEKCNVWNRLISIFFYHQNVGFNGHRTPDQEDDDTTRWEMTLILAASRKRMFRW